ncbi:MAG: hypothetical protein WEB53_04600 [Akkermansiaceae bacterium]
MPQLDLKIVRNGKQDRPGRFPDPEDLPRRILQIAALRGLGYPLRTIGQNYGVTPQAISVLLARHKAALRAARNHAGRRGLPLRVVNVLGHLRIKDRTVTEWEERLRGLRNCGQKAIAEIRAWAADGLA